MGLWPIADQIAGLRERPILFVLTAITIMQEGGLFQFDNRLGHSAEAEIFAYPIRANTVADLLGPFVIKAPPNP